MSGVFYSMGWWWDYFRILFNIGAFSVDGSIVLGTGVQQVEIQLPYPNPRRIFISAQEPVDDIPTCIGTLNWVSARLLRRSFIVFAEVKTNSCEVSYIVEYSSSENPAERT
jgi:hypothetical protein